MQTYWNADGNGADAFSASFGYTELWAAPEVASWVGRCRLTDETHVESAWI